MGGGLGEWLVAGVGWVGGWGRGVQAAVLSVRESACMRLCICACVCAASVHACGSAQWHATARTWSSLCYVCHAMFSNTHRVCTPPPTGIGATSTGHCHPHVVKAVQEQAGKIVHAQQNVLAGHVKRVSE